MDHQERLRAVLSAVRAELSERIQSRIAAPLKCRLCRIDPAESGQLPLLLGNTLATVCEPLLQSALVVTSSRATADAAEGATTLWRNIEARGLDHLDHYAPGWSDAANRWLVAAEEALFEWLDRYLDNRSQLSSLLDGGPLGRLDALEPLSRESHNRGRRPLLLGFSCGTRIVYKPRSAAAECLFESVVGRIRDDHEHLAELRLPKVIDHGTHCWSQFVEHVTCDDPSVHRGYYHRLGGWLAVVHALRAGDLHHQNLIAAGIDPIPVDLEVALQPRLPWNTPRLDARENTVLATGLMPQRAPGTGGDNWNQSGIATSSTVQQSVPVLSVDHRGQVTLRSARRALPGLNAPFRDDPDPEAWNGLCEALLTGFSQYHRALSRSAGDPDFQQWIQARTAGFEGRVLLRETRHYAQLHEALHHAKALAGELDVEAVLGKLELGLPQAPQLREVLAAERASLTLGDVPAFHARADSRDLYWQGEVLARDFFTESGRSVLQRRLGGLGRSDRHRQRALIADGMGRYLAPRPCRPPRLLTSSLNRTAFLHPRGSNEAGLAAYPVARSMPAPGVTQRAALGLASSIGEWLLERETGGYWFQSQFSPDRGTVCPIAVTDRLGDGRLGIALFLSALVAQSIPGFETTARRLYASIAREASAGRVPAGIGAHEGLGGHIWAFCAGSSLLQDRSLLQFVDSWLDLIAERIPHDRFLDVYAGSAGALLACCELARLGGNERALEVARACRRHLLATVVETGDGMAWPHPAAPPDANLLGMAHGTHGIAMALSRLQSVDPDPEVDALLPAVLAYEDACFDPASGRWPDLRKPPHLARDPEREESWCSGAAGIGLASLERARGDSCGTLVEQARRARDATLRRLHCRSACLCHGTLGNAWLLRRYDTEFGLDSSDDVIEGILRHVIEQVRDHGLVCGVEPNRPLPGLMSGVSGIGYGLLMLSGPRALPDPLTLALPDSAQRGGALA